MMQGKAATGSSALAPEAKALRVVLCGTAPPESWLADLAAADRPSVLHDVTGADRTAGDLIAAAANAEIAVVTLDAADGFTRRIRQELALLGLSGIRRAVLAIRGDAARAAGIARELAGFAGRAGIAHVATAVPPADGATVAGLLDGPGAKDSEDAAFRFRIAKATRDGSGAVALSGRVLGGAVRAGDRVRVWPSRAEARIERILGRRGATAAACGETVTLVLDGDVGAAPGDVVAAAGDSALALADQLQATLIWFAAEPLVPGRRYLARFGTAETAAEVTTLKHRLDFDDGAHVSARALGRDEAGVVTLTLDRALPFDGHAINRHTGAFRLFDEESGDEVGYGIIDYALRRATNVVWHDTAIGKSVRAGLKGQRPVCLWFTGLSGSGKSTVANMVDQRLTAAGRHTYVLDGDNIRHGLNHDLGFTETDRVENIRRMAEVARLMVDAGLIVMVCAISPYHRDREMARGLFEDGEFVEVFVDTPLAECETRDPKGLYRKARSGQIPNFTGISAPYEAPDAPEIRLDGTRPIDELVERVFARLGI